MKISENVGIIYFINTQRIQRQGWHAAELLNELDNAALPRVLSQVEGVTRSYGGQSEYVQKMVGSMTYSMSIALIIMFTILMFLFKSYWQTILVISLIPLGLIGAIAGHYIMGIPLSILSFLSFLHLPLLV